MVESIETSNEAQFNEIRKKFDKEYREIEFRNFCFLENDEIKQLFTPDISLENRGFLRRAAAEASKSL